ncbi:Lysozyme g [Merluccius polli]|uniref:Lysozyme g n=1 Tax=Merluccius polli TaxID=89951 RepID=A0AA47NLF0_MERPO|nr:Lysozyme g [Merluccius polli]
MSLPEPSGMVWTQLSSPGIISRVCRAGNTIKGNNGWGDHGNAFGLMQWNGEEHLNQATGILVNFIKKIQNKFPDWGAEQKLKAPLIYLLLYNTVSLLDDFAGAIAAYNMGDDNVDSYENVDQHTTGGDYSNDVDVNPNGGNHKAEGKWDSEEHLNQATGILVDFIKKIQNKFPNWGAEQKLKGAIAAYNMGDGNVHSYENVDQHTTGGDYSNDVTARAQWYKRHGY